MAQPQRTPPQRGAQKTYTYTTRARRRKSKRKQVVAFLVMLAAVGVLFVVALLVAGGRQNQEPPSAAPSVASTPAVVVAPPASQPPVSVSQPPARTPTAWDEAALPPLYNYANPLPEMQFTWLERADDATSAGQATGGAQQTQLLNIGNGQYMELRAAQAFMAMQAAAAADGITLTPVSGYRSNQQQTNNYNASIQRYLNEGLSQEDAVARTQRYYAIPGTSEHEAGLAIDVNWVDDGFAQSAAYTWLQENITRFGFIYRYKAETEDITHIAWEPWHYRYVGANHAEAIAEKGITLEEYIEDMKMG